MSYAESLNPDSAVDLDHFDRVRAYSDPLPVAHRTGNEGDGSVTRSSNSKSPLGDRALSVESSPGSRHAVSSEENGDKLSSAVLVELTENEKKLQRAMGTESSELEKKKVIDLRDQLKPHMTPYQAFLIAKAILKMTKDPSLSVSFIPVKIRKKAGILPFSLHKEGNGVYIKFDEVLGTGTFNTTSDGLFINLKKDEVIPVAIQKPLKEKIRETSFDLRKLEGINTNLLEDARQQLRAEGVPHVAKVLKILRYTNCFGQSRIATVLEKAPGTLEARLSHLTTAQRLKCARQVANALTKLNARGIIHLDVKIDNVLLTKEGDAKLIDFGCAVRPGQNPHTFCFAIAPPEIIAGEKPASSKTDAYEFGIMLLTLFAPEGEGSYKQLMNAANYSNAKRVHTKLMLPIFLEKWEPANDFDKVMKEIIVQATEADPNKRISMAQIAQKLEVLPN